MFTLLNSKDISQQKYNYQELFNRVNKELGPGFLVPIGILRESIYHKALEIRFAEEEIKFESEKEISVSFHKKFVGLHRLDFLVEKEIVLELKTVKEIHKKYYAQVRSYLSRSDPYGKSS